MERIFIIAVVTYMLSSTGLILLSNIIFNRYYFNYIITLATIYFLANYLLCEILICTGYVKRKWLPRREAIYMGLTWAGSIVFTNYWLRENTHGWHQAIKLVLIPVLVLWQWWFFRIKTDLRELFALIPVIMGTTIIVIERFTPSTSNLIYGSMQLLNAAAFQTWVSTKSKEHDMNPLQLLHNSALACFLILLPFAPFLDRFLAESWMFMTNFHRSFFSYALVMAVLTMLLNISSFAIIVYKGPMAFQVVGCMKMVLVFVVGQLMLGTSPESIKLLAALIALGGIFVYAYVKEQLWLQQFWGYQKVELSSLDRELGDLDESLKHIVERVQSDSEELGLLKSNEQAEEIALKSLGGRPHMN